MTRTPRQKGSAFFIILIAIAFFAALSYAVFRGGSVTGNTLSAEQAKLAAQEIVSYGDTVAKAVQTLKLRGCTDTQFDFSNTNWKNTNGSYVHPAGHNPNASAGCGVFTAHEGNLQTASFSANYFQSGAFTTLQGSSRIRMMSFKGVGTETDKELFYNLPIITDDVCLQINRILGVESGDNIPDIAEGPVDDYSGDYGALSAPYTDTDGLLNGKTAFCARISTPSVNNKFFRVLIAR